MKLLWIIKHAFILIIGLAFMSLGVSLAKIASLGTSPISSIPNVMSLLTPITIGNITIIFMVAIVILEFIILRNDFGWANIIQLVPSIIFGVMTDFFVKCLDFLHLTNYLQQLGLTLVSIVFLSVGVFFEINSQTIVMAGEGIVIALSSHYMQNFSVMKVRSDLTMMIIAAGISVLYFHGFDGIREGTILSALITGRLEFAFEQISPKLVAWMRR